MVTCPSCRREQAQASAFCAYCGAVLDKPTTSAASAGDAPGSTPATATMPVSGTPVHHDVGDIGAYFVRRLGALATDLIVVGGLIAIALRAWLARSAPGGALTAPLFFELAALVVAGLFLYRWLLEGIVGTTLGKLVFGLVTARRGGGPPGPVRAFVRNLVLPIDLAVIGFLVAAVSPQRRRLGDLVAGTVVVNSRIGVLAPVTGLALIAAAGYGVHAYAGGLTTAQHLARDATQFGPSLFGGASPAPELSPAAPTPSPLPSLTPAISPSPSPSAPVSSSTS